MYNVIWDLFPEWNLNAFAFYFFYFNFPFPLLSGMWKKKKVGSCSLTGLFFFFFTVAVFSGHSNSSFYVKSSVSPDDQFLASGSSDHHAYIWKVRSRTNLED